jgi:hypothetical protein
LLDTLLPLVSAGLQCNIVIDFFPSSQQHYYDLKIVDILPILTTRILYPGLRYRFQSPKEYLIHDIQDMIRCLTENPAWLSFIENEVAKFQAIIQDCDVGLGDSYSMNADCFVLTMKPGRGEQWMENGHIIPFAGEARRWWERKGFPPLYSAIRLYQQDYGGKRHDAW